MRQHGHTRHPHARSVADGPQDCRCGGDQRRLADTLGTKRSLGLAILDQMDLHGWHIANRGDEIVVQVLGTAGDEFLDQRQAQALGDAAVDLPFHQGRVDGPADVVGGHDRGYFAGAEADVDLHLGHLRGKAVRGVGDALAVLVERRGRRIPAADAFQNDVLSRDGRRG